MTPFSERFPSSDMLILHSRKGQPLPEGEYGFTEWYCDEDGCDCRRVLYIVLSPQFPGRRLATINYGWESEKFYTTWMHGDAEAGREICGGCLDPLNEQSEFAEELLRGFRETVKAKPEIKEHLKRHYEMFKGGGLSKPPSR